MIAHENAPVVCHERDAERWRQLAREIAATGFVEGNLQRVAVATRAMMFEPISFTPFLRGSEACRAIPLGAMIECFQEGGAIRFAVLEGLFSSRSLQLMEESGLVVRDGASATASVCLVPWKGLILASDRYDRTAADFVYRPNQPTLQAEASIPPLRPGARCLDIGTGSGVLAIILQLEGAQATGVDPNPRALEFCRLNSIWNGALPPIATEVADHRLLGKTRDWDLVLFNMPLTYQPSERLSWGFPGDSLGIATVREVYGSLPGALAPGGLASMRHDMKHACLSPDAFIAEAGIPDGLQVLYYHEGEELYGMRQQRPPSPELDAPQAADWVIGGAMIRRLRSPGPSQVSFVPLGFQDVQVTPRSFWTRLVSVEGWADALCPA